MDLDTIIISIPIILAMFSIIILKAILVLTKAPDSRLLILPDTDLRIWDIRKYSPSYGIKETELIKPLVRGWGKPIGVKVNNDISGRIDRYGIPFFIPSDNGYDVVKDFQYSEESTY